jgi:hypothetical protein
MSTAVKKKSQALDKIIVKRPSPSPELLQGTPPPPPPTAVNPEFQQKPLAELDMRTSEDFHGGSEQTFSMPVQRGSQQNGDGGGRPQQKTEQKENTQNRDKETEGKSEKEPTQEAAGQQSARVGDAQQESSLEGSQQQEHEDDQQQEREEDAEAEDEWEFDDEEDEESGGSRTGAFNTAQVVDVAEGDLGPELRRLQTEFYRLLEMLAEEKTKHFDPSLVGGLVKAEYNVKKMALRRYEGKPPTRYKAPRVREAVVLVLDNSGSMYSWAEMLTAMAELAAKRRDVEVYLAPNGYVEEQIAPVRRKVSHDDFMKKMSGRKIIYVGDFDGTNTPVELSWRNEVIWIAPESRYRRFLSHSWAKYDESKYKGAFIRTFTIGDTIKALRKVLGGAKWIDMCMKCEDE